MEWEGKEGGWKGWVRVGKGWEEVEGTGKRWEESGITRMGWKGLRRVGGGYGMDWGEQGKGWKRQGTDRQGLKETGTEGKSRGKVQRDRARGWSCVLEQDSFISSQKPFGTWLSVKGRGFIFMSYNTGILFTAPKTSRSWTCTWRVWTSYHIHTLTPREAGSNSTCGYRKCGKSWAQCRGAVDHQLDCEEDTKSGQARQVSYLFLFSAFQLYLDA